MDYVIEIQGFRDINKKFLPKEVAVVTVDNNYSAHWIVEPPYPFSELGERERSANNYVTCYLHGLEWFEGDIPLKRLYRHLQEIAGSAYRILTRGYEKAKFLEMVTARKIINLENTDCPAFEKLDSGNEYCLVHGVKKEEFFSCALNNAAKLKKWLLKNKVLREYDYPTHAAHITGKCVRSHTHSTSLRTGVSTPAQKDQHPPPVPERTSSKIKSDHPPPPRKQEQTDEICSRLVKTLKPLDLSTRFESESEEEASENGMTEPENNKDEQPSNSACVISVIPQQLEHGFPSRQDPPGVDTTDRDCCKHG